MKRTQKWNRIPLLLLLLAVLAGVIYILARALFPLQQREDYRRISSEVYDSVFLSTYPVFGLEKEDFTYYLGTDPLITSYCIPKRDVLGDYVRRIAQSGNTISKIYLGVRPDIIPSEDILALAADYPGVSFDIFLSYPSLDYWSGLSEDGCGKLLQAYSDFITALLPESRISLYSFSASEWLIANPTNYESDFSVHADIARKLLLLCYMNQDYLLTADNATPTMEALTLLVTGERSTPSVYPDYSDRAVVFFGDSIIGNYTDSTSIPGVVSGLTGATVYNCGYGGNSAALWSDIPISLPGIVSALTDGDVSSIPTDAQAHAGISAYLENPPTGKALSFIISYGLNDYFEGLPLSGPDPYDITSYMGAIRTAVDTLQSNFPEAQIILMTPTFCTYFKEGTEKQSEAGGVLTDYVDAVLSLGKELSVTVMDNYRELGINAQNQAEYLVDGCHPKENGCYLIGNKIIEALGQ